MSTLKELKQEEYKHVASMGGWLEIPEADCTLNDLNRKQIAAFKNEYKSAYLGNVNYYDEKRKQIVNGETSIFTEYNGQLVYNFEYSFCVPEQDETLENMIRQWNGKLPNDEVYNLIDKIQNRIDELGGINFIWS